VLFRCAAQVVQIGANYQCRSSQGKSNKSGDLFSAIELSIGPKTALCIFVERNKTISLMLGRNMTNTEQITLTAGWGYWDITHYPYGGNFKRLVADTAVTVIERYDKRHETKVRFTDGSVGVITNRAIQESAQE
jgi:hypothetical protein